jgi:Ca2+-binding EF-hand superfamily protein
VFFLFYIITIFFSKKKQKIYMSREEQAHYASLLYEVVEPNNSSAIPVDQVAELLKLINPALDAIMAAGIASDHDSKGKQTLTKQDFCDATAFALQTTDMGDAIQIIRDLTIRMRVAFRRRYLMYDAPASTPPPALLENARAVSMYRDLWDFLCSGTEQMTRPQLRKLMAAVLVDHPSEASNVVKAALGDRETDTISFLEFLMVVQQATSVRPLSDMVTLARRKFDQDRDLQVAAQRKIDTMISGAGFGAERALTISTQLKENARLQQEVASILSSENVASERAKSVLYAGTSSGRASTLLDSLPVVPSPLTAPRPAADVALEREVAHLRMENERLLHTLAVQGGKGGPGDEQTNIAMVKVQREKEQQLHEHIRALENELRQARAQIAISTEAAELVSLLRQAPVLGKTKTEILKEHFIEENNLMGKHRYIREVAARFEDPNSPVSLLIGQYELLVSGYQALYRELKGRWEFAKTKRFNPMEAAKNIVQQAQNTPSAGKPLSAPSPVQVNSAVFSWAELDCPPSDQLRHTGLPGDPLLTDQERQVLRAKLAAQMRSTARHYTPSKSQSRNNNSNNNNFNSGNNNYYNYNNSNSNNGSIPRSGSRTPSFGASHYGGGGGSVGYATPSTADRPSDPHSDSIDAIRQLQALTPNSRRF